MISHADGFSVGFLKQHTPSIRKRFMTRLNNVCDGDFLKRPLIFLLISFLLVFCLFVLFAYLSLSAHCHSNLSYQCLAIVFQKKFYHSFDQSDSKLERTATLSFVCDRIYGQVTELVSK